MSLSQGECLGPYEILSPLGVGGMGEVYRARDKRLDRTVAIKILSPDARRSESLDRFRAEARTLSRLSHPHICTLYDVGEENGVAFLVMEYLEGETLADRLSSGPLPLGQALQHAHHIASALDEAHRQGVIHRDLKPGNIMLTRAGVKVLDFGLAKFRAPEDEVGSHVGTRSFDLTSEGVILGTMPYMAPEQLEGRPADARTDIFAFGVVLYETLTGARPFKGTSRASLIASILSSEPEPLTARRPQVPPLLERVVRRCLAKDPEERWQTARDLAAELKFVQESGAEAAASVAASGRGMSRWLVASGLVASTVAAVLALVLAKSPRASNPSYRQLTFRSGFITSARFAPDGDSVVYGAAWDGRPSELFLGRLGSTEARPLGLKNARVLSISRSGEMALMLGGPNSLFQGTLARAPLAGGVPRELQREVNDADWIADTGQLAVLRPGPMGGSVLEFPLGKKIYESRLLAFLRVSPRGDRVAVLEWTTPGQGDVVAVDSTGKKTVLSRGWVGLFGLAWAPGGDEVWFTGTRPSLEEGPPALRAVSLSGKERLVTRAPTWLFLNEVFRDGRVLLGSNLSRGCVRCSIAGETGERELGWLDSSEVRSLSADGKTLLFGEGAGSTRIIGGVFAQGVAAGAPDGAVYQRGTDGSAAVHLGEGHPMDLSPDGRWVLATGSNLKEWVLLPTGPEMPKSLPLGDITRTYAGRWLDDSHIAFAGFEPGRPMRGFVQDVESGAVRPVTPEGVPPPDDAMAFPGGKFVLAFDGSSRPPWGLYPVDGGAVRPLSFESPVIPVAWSGDGRNLYVTDPGDLKTALHIYRHDVATGRRLPWKTLSISDPAGLESIGPVVISPDGGSYCYTYTRTLGTMYVVEGVR